MAIVVNKQVEMTRTEIIKFQIITYCYMRKIVMSESDYDCLTLVGALGESDLSEFCTIASSCAIFKTTQTVRNCLVKMEKQGLIDKKGRSKKRISLNAELSIQVTGTILLNYKIFSIAS